MSAAPPRHRVIRLLGVSFAWLLFAATTVVLLAWLVGRVVSDRFVWSQFLLWMPTLLPLLMAVTVLCIACALKLRRMAIACLTFTGALGVYFSFFEHRLVRRLDDSDGIRIVNWNVQRFDYDRESRGPYAQPLIDLQGDITILTSGGNVAWDPGLLDAIGNGSRPVRQYPFAVVTAFPIVEFTSLVATSDGIYLALLRVQLDDAPVNELVLLLADLPSDPMLSRAEIAARISTLLGELEPAIPEFDVVVGDFNITRGAWSLSRMFPQHHHAFNDGGAGFGISFYDPLPLYHIDHTLISAEWHAVRYELINTGLTRHAIQVADIMPR